MKKLVLGLIMLCISIPSFAAAPNRPNTYSSGTTIGSVAVTQNETTLYSYLQAGVDTYKAGSITSTAVSSTAGITYSQLNLSGGISPSDFNTSTTTNIYTLQNLTVPYNLNIGASPTTNTILFFNSSDGGGYVPTQLGYSGPTYPYVKVSNTQISGTNGGTSTSGSWQTAILNQIDNNSANIATLSSNTVSLPAGTYLVSGYQDFYQNPSGTIMQLRIYNSTTSTVLVNGINNESSAGNSNVANVEGEFTLSGTSNIILQYQTGQGVATSGLGAPGGYGTEVYAVVQFTKIL